MCVPKKVRAEYFGDKRLPRGGPFFWPARGTGNVRVNP